MKRKEKSKLVIVIIIFISIVIIFIQVRPVDVQKIPASFAYSNVTGFDITKGELTFGSLTKNQDALRKMVILNDEDFNVIVNLKSSGEIKDYLIVSENNFELIPGEEKTLSFSVNPGESLTEYRKYEGVVEIIIKRA